MRRRRFARPLTVIDIDADVERADLLAARHCRPAGRPPRAAAAACSCAAAAATVSRRRQLTPSCSRCLDTSARTTAGARSPASKSRRGVAHGRGATGAAGLVP
eukprot:360255-Chlamydomonas_euryale.AAC.2